MGVKLSYSDRGQGVPLMFLHGFCGSRDYWEDLVPLLEKERRVITPDLRGHGKSGMPSEEPQSIEQMASDVHMLAEELALGSFFLFGHSMGGYISLAYAERWPGDLAGLSLIHSTAYPDDEMGKKGRTESIMTVREKGIAPFVSRLVPNLFADPGSPYIEKALKIGEMTSPQGAIGALEAMRERPARHEALKNPDVPVLLVAGELDRIVPPEKMFSVSGPHIEQAVLKGCGHMGMFENPALLAERILSFTDRPVRR